MRQRVTVTDSRPGVCNLRAALSFTRAPHAMYAQLPSNKLTELKRVASDSIADAKVLYIVSKAIYTLLPSVNQSHATAHR